MNDWHQTPKEKADELITVFGSIYRKYNTNDLLFSERRTGKECAIKAVNEICRCLWKMGGEHIPIKNSEYNLEYWNKVEEELNSENT